MGNKKKLFVPDRSLYSVEEAASAAGVSTQQVLRAARDEAIRIWVDAPACKVIRSVCPNRIEVEALRNNWEALLHRNKHPGFPMISVDAHGMLFGVAEDDCDQIASRGWVNQSIFWSALRFGSDGKPEIIDAPKRDLQDHLRFMYPNLQIRRWVFAAFDPKDKGDDATSRINIRLDPSNTYVTGDDLQQYISGLPKGESDSELEAFTISPECDGMVRAIYCTMKRFSPKLVEPIDGSKVWEYATTGEIVDHFVIAYDFSPFMARSLAPVVRPIRARKGQEDELYQAYRGAVTPEFVAIYRGWEHRHQLKKTKGIVLTNKDMRKWLKKHYPGLSASTINAGAAAICNEEEMNRTAA